MKDYRHYHGSNISFIDMLFNIIIVFVLLFFVTVMLMNPQSKKEDIESKADILITMTWPDLNPHDIDLWIKPPNGSAISYNHRENSYVFLDRDDLGISNNFMIKDGEKIVLAPRREVVSFRGKQSGRYVANVHFFLSKTPEGAGLIPGTYDGTPVPVVVELVQINPVYKILAKKEISLTKVKEERTAFSFIIRDEIVADIEIDIEEPFIQNYAISSMGP